MKLVIDIPEEQYVTLNAKSQNEVLTIVDHALLIKAIKNGAPIPKGHGRTLIVLEDIIKRELISLDFSCQKWVSEIGLSNATLAIIEADKAESEDKE